MVVLLACLAAACTPVASPTSLLSTQPSRIDYQRSGGFIGVQDHLTIDLNSHATLTRRTGATELDLSRGDLGAIQAAFQAAGYASLPENPTCDRGRWILVRNHLLRAYGANRRSSGAEATRAGDFDDE